MAEHKLNINIDEPRYDQSTYSGRAKHFFITTNPLTLFATGKALNDAKDLVERYRKGETIPGLTEDKLWKAKHLYDSAFHPDTKEKMFVLGRIPSLVPMSMTITGCMMTFYKTTPAAIFWQWVNQTYMALVNYTNRSGDTPISAEHLGLSYTMATGGAVATALTLNSLVNKMPPLIGRFVPFAAVAAGNIINIPCMRSKELISGIPVFDADGNRVGESTRAAASAITQVVVTRVILAMPQMTIPPVIMNALEKKPFMKRYPWLNAPLQGLMIGCLLVFTLPLCCAFFPQKSSMSVASLEPEVRKRIEHLPNAPKFVYFNKGL